MTVVRTRGLTKSYGATPALRGLDLDVEAGEIFGFLGPNGAGKTTTLRLMMGLLRPSAGSAILLGHDAWTEAPAVHARVGYLPGDLVLPPRHSARSLLALAGRLRGQGPGGDPAYAEKLADRLDLDLDRPVGALSKGNRQKVGLLLAFWHRPALLLLDEPTTGLDPLVRQQFQELLGEVVADGGSVLLSSHVLSEVQRVAHRVGILRAGQLVAVETLDALRAKAAHRVEARFATPPPVDAFDGLPGVLDPLVDGDVLTCRSQGPVGPLLRAIAAYDVLELHSVEADLDEVFLAYYGEEPR